MQQEIFDIQKRPAAWGLVIPFLEHPDPNVQFFGAHTAQVKIARDWYVHRQYSFGIFDLPSAGKHFRTSTMKNCATCLFNSHRVPSQRPAIKSFFESYMSRCVTAEAVLPFSPHSPASSHLSPSFLYRNILLGGQGGFRRAFHPSLPMEVHRSTSSISWPS